MSKPSLIEESDGKRSIIRVSLGARTLAYSTTDRLALISMRDETESHGQFTLKSLKLEFVTRLLLMIQLIRIGIMNL